jgi:hypothetical protein
MVDLAPGGRTLTGGALTLANAIDLEPGERTLDGCELLPVFPPDAVPPAGALAGGVRVAVYNATGTTFIANIPRRRGVSWQDEHNTPGMGSFQIQRDDAVIADNPSLLDDFNIVKFYVDGKAVKTWIIEQVQRTLIDEDDRWMTVSGRGALALLGAGVIYPEWPLRRDSADERSFDYGSKSGGWFRAAEWKTPAGIPVGAANSIRKGHPKGWPSKRSQWLWSTNPNRANKDGVNYFRGVFTLSAKTRVRIWAAGDDDMELQLDGEVLFSQKRGGWHKASAKTMVLAAGNHLIAARVRNYDDDANNSGAFVCYVGKVDRKNKILATVMRSTPAKFSCRGYYDKPPGWFPASVLKTLVSEAQARGVEGLSAITFGFTDTVDSAGRAWQSRQDQSYPIGTTSLLDLVERLTEDDLDVAMTTGLELRAWRTRGADRTRTVRLLPVQATKADATSTSSRVRSRALVRTRHGWLEIVDSDATAAYGRREVGLTAGGAGSDNQATKTAQAAFREVGAPEVTIPVGTSAQVGPQPYADYNIYDIVTGPAMYGGLGPARVMTISATEDNESGVLSYVTELYPEV